jgi:hypothetical protein
MQKKNTYTLKLKVWLHPGHAGWHFVTVPKKESVLIRDATKGIKRGWGSVRVCVTLGETTWDTTWDTSIFADAKFGTYLLPLKSDVRKKEEIEEGDVVKVGLVVLL